jgi:hypothetical protein
MIMFALALCNPEFLPRDYNDCEPEDRWRRLDDVQREAVVSWWRS